MIDIHTHVLPEVDDGARSWEMAIHMCHMAASDGIEHMVATPHANDEYFYDREWLRAVLDELRRRVGPAPQLYLGCDFHFSYENLQRLSESPHRFTIEDTPYLLVELSDFAVPPAVTTQLEDLLGRGLQPILTHPERNPLLLRRPDRVLQWVTLGCAVQVTASALTGLWGETAKQMAHWLLRRGAVHVLASDCHSIDGRPPVLSAARDIVTEVYGPVIAQALVDTNPRAILSAQPLPYFPPIKARTGRR